MAATNKYFPRIDTFALSTALLDNTLTALRAEYRENPLGTDAREPRLSWQIQANGRGMLQSAYQVRVARSERDLQNPVESSRSVGLAIGEMPGALHTEGHVHD